MSTLGAKQWSPEWAGRRYWESVRIVDGVRQVVMGTYRREYDFFDESKKAKKRKP